MREFREKRKGRNFVIILKLIKRWRDNVFFSMKAFLGLWKVCFKALLQTFILSVVKCIVFVFSYVVNGLFFIILISQLSHIFSLYHVKAHTS